MGAVLEYRLTKFHHRKGCAQSPGGTGASIFCAAFLGLTLLVAPLKAALVIGAWSP